MTRDELDRSVRESLERWDTMTAGTPAATIIKTCGKCERRYAPQEWRTLRRLGDQPSETEAGGPAYLELRNCSCGSTLAIEHEGTRDNLEIDALEREADLAAARAEAAILREAVDSLLALEREADLAAARAEAAILREAREAVDSLREHLERKSHELNLARQLAQATAAQADENGTMLTGVLRDVLIPMQEEHSHDPRCLCSPCCYVREIKRG